mmetsp:Transcript_54868/g.59470  ORF Transcript_54868/g.59470 Transcript_54868/m.59470 type:complete len:305 (-) Transcript_54868:38-952(-)
MQLISSNFLAFALSSLTMTHAFSSPHHRATTTTATTSPLMMATSPQQSRRDLLTTVVGTATAAAAALVMAPSAVEAKDAAPAATGVTGSQGVWFDPKHPDGYRAIRIKGGKSGVMTLSDGLSKEEILDEKVEKTYNDIPVKLNGEDNTLTIDFSFKGGPKDVVGVLSEDGKKLTFPDGNTWVKNKFKFDGVYSVTDTTGKTLIPGAYRVLRQGKERKNKGFTTIVNVELGSDKGKSTFVKAKQQGSLLAIPTVDFTFYQLPTGGSGKEAKVEEEVIGSLYLVKRNTIAPYGTFVFPDGTRWSQL